MLFPVGVRAGDQFFWITLQVRVVIEIQLAIHDAPGFGVDIRNAAAE